MFQPTGLIKCTVPALLFNGASDLFVTGVTLSKQNKTNNLTLTAQYYFDYSQMK
jgi:predicted dienelactone hydrolase